MTGKLSFLISSDNWEYILLKKIRISLNLAFEWRWPYVIFQAAFSPLPTDPWGLNGITPKAFFLKTLCLPPSIGIDLLTGNSTNITLSRHFKEASFGLECAAASKSDQRRNEIQFIYYRKEIHIAFEFGGTLCHRHGTEEAMTIKAV